MSAGSRIGLVGLNIMTMSASQFSVLLNHLIACTVKLLSFALSPESSAGRKKGVSAPYWRAIIAIFSSSVEQITRVVNFELRACSIDQASSGRPASGNIFLFARLL